MKVRATTAFFRVAVSLVLAILTAGCEEGPGPGPADSPRDPADHPLYSEYVFGESDEVIDIGIQPLWVPTCIIAETMRRDLRLREALAGQGLEIRFHAFYKGANVNVFLERGDLEGGIGGDMPALTAAANGVGVIVAIVQQGFCSIVARRHMLMGELRGKRIGYAFGSNAHYALLEALRSVGLGEEDVEMAAMDVHEMAEALDSERIDAFSAWEPTPTLAHARFNDQVVIHRGLSSGYLYFTPAFARSRPEAVRRIAASEARALSWLREDDAHLLKASGWAIAAGRELSGASPLLSPREYADLANQDLLAVFRDPTIPKNDLASHGRLAAEFRLLARLGKIPPDLTWDDVSSAFDRGVMESVLREPEKYGLSVRRYEEKPSPTLGPPLGPGRTLP